MLAARLAYAYFLSLVEELTFVFKVWRVFSYLAILAFVFSIFSSLFSSSFSRRLLHLPFLAGFGLGSSKSSYSSVIYVFGVVFILIKFVECICALRFLVIILEGDVIMIALSTVSL